MALQIQHTICALSLSLSCSSLLGLYVRIVRAKLVTRTCYKIKMCNKPLEFGGEFHFDNLLCRWPMVGHNSLLPFSKTHTRNKFKFNWYSSAIHNEYHQRIVFFPFVIIVTTILSQKMNISIFSKKNEIVRILVNHFTT